MFVFFRHTLAKYIRELITIVKILMVQLHLCKLVLSGVIRQGMEWLQRANALAYFAKWQWRWKKFYNTDLQVDEEDDFIEYPPGEQKIFTTVIKNILWS